ncbi:E3 ubiquitin-protein ligase RGLG2 [Acorus calamus]|uniref:E3 ubiquitin-protein ligase RGLG2 n=1 Tax=Acorus calamus TaxID=4465 RepID=A0AAV9CYA6_ACOCL|nr:E3 ubiquitin-protein ligase RGLG2 [Acorus calamus]
MAESDSNPSWRLSLAPLSGKVSFNHRSLHSIGYSPNPYEQAISIIGRTLSAFDEDNLISCYGFGDGPTSFAPMIETAIGIVDSSGGQYHVLLIIADGQDVATTKDAEITEATSTLITSSYSAIE